MISFNQLTEVQSTVTDGTINVPVPDCRFKLFLSLLNIYYIYFQEYL